MNTTFNVITLNAWGLKFISTHRLERMQAIGDYLLQSAHDIVGLQEIWVEYDTQRLRSQLAPVYPYSRYFYNGMFGSGLLLFSKHPFVHTFTHPYSLNGSPLRFWQGDWFAGKSFGYARIKHKDVGDVDVFITHTHASYGGNEEHRSAQAWEISTWMALSKVPTIALGDFNSKPDTLAYKLIQNVGGMQDAWKVAFDAGWTEESEVADGHTNGRKSRIDYVFYKGSSEVGVGCVGAAVRMSNPVPSQTFKYSDHSALEARLVFTPGSSMAPNTQQAIETVRGLNDMMHHYLQDNITTERWFTMVSQTLALVCLVMIMGKFTKISADALDAHSRNESFTLWKGVKSAMWVLLVCVVFCAMVIAFLMAWLHVGGWERSAIHNILADTDMYIQNGGL